MRVVIIETDKIAYRQLVKLLHEVEPSVQVVAHLKNSKEALEWLQKNKPPDLVFSVISLPDGLCFEIFNKLEHKIPVIFTCSNEKYALAAFNSTGIYYLLKPFREEELREAIRKYKSRSFKTASQKITGIGGWQKRFLVNIGKQMKLIPVEEIAYFYTEKKMVYLVCFDSSKYVLNTTLEKLETQLNPETFFRINRQFIVNLASIARMSPATKSRQQLFLRPRPVQATITSLGRTSEFYRWLTGNF